MRREMRGARFTLSLPFTSYYLWHSLSVLLLSTSLTHFTLSMALSSHSPKRSLNIICIAHTFLLLLLFMALTRNAIVFHSRNIHKLPILFISFASILSLCLSLILILVLILILMSQVSPVEFQFRDIRYSVGDKAILR